jgi:hypothetical protein
VEKYGTAGQVTDDSVLQLMRFACWITKAADTHSEFVKLICFARQKLFGQRALILHYIHITSFVFVNFKDSRNTDISVPHFIHP